MNNILSEKDTVAIQDIIIRQLDVRRDQLMPEARILADLGADSLDVVEISMALEELFDVTIPDEQWDKVDTVGESPERENEFGDDGGEEIAAGVSGLDDAGEYEAAAMGRNAFHGEGGADAPLAAHADAVDGAQEKEEGVVGGEAAEEFDDGEEYDVGHAGGRGVRSGWRAGRR